MLAFFVEDDDLRVQIFFVLDDDHSFLAGGLVSFLLHRDALDDVMELHLAGLFGKNGHAVRVPLDEGFALLDLAAVLYGDNGADDDVMLFEFAAILADDGNGGVFVEDNVVAVFELDAAEVFAVAEGTIISGLD